MFFGVKIIFGIDKHKYMVIFNETRVFILMMKIGIFLHTKYYYEC